jgi:23S rRNA G2069 N7-methylase RlmK/C1962 C5-methylase RlmI
MTKIILKKGRHDRILSGHPWVYGNEIESVKGDVQPGDIVEVFDSKNYFIGKGYYNSKSQITVRLLDEGIRRKILTNHFSGAGSKHVLNTVKKLATIRITGLYSVKPISYRAS